MQQLLLFAIIGIGIVGMSVGFAQNAILLNVQQLGVGENFITSPISAADVDFELGKVQRSVDAIPNNADDYFVNLITGCSFRTAEEIKGPATVICKLTDDRNGKDKFGAVIAEGRVELPNGLAANTRTVIPIIQTAFQDANDVQLVHDVKIIVQGPDPTKPVIDHISLP